MAILNPKIKIKMCCLFLACGLMLSGGVAFADKVVDAIPDNETTDGNSTDNKKDDDTKVVEASPTQSTEGDNPQTVQDGQGWNEEGTSYYRDGKKVKGIQKIDDKLFFFDKKGKLYKKKGLVEIGGKKYYFNKDFSLKTGVVSIKKKRYYFSRQSGARCEETGIQKVDNRYYCFTKKHTLKTGWHRDEHGKRYYFHKKTCAALVGWNYVGRYRFYFEKDGRLCQDVRQKLSKREKSSYYIKVNRTGCCVTVYAKDEERETYCIPVVAFVCSPGADTPTGDFQIKDKLRWHELMGPCWGQWCEHLTPDVLFHSVFYDKQNDNRSLNVAAYNRLGTMASHGCVRLTAGDAKWIYDNCKVGTKVKIYNNSKDMGPFDKPKAKTLNAGHTWDPTDPTIK